MAVHSTRQIRGLTALLVCGSLMLSPRHAAAVDAERVAAQAPTLVAAAAPREPGAATQARPQPEPDTGEDLPALSRRTLILLSGAGLVVLVVLRQVQ